MRIWRFVELPDYVTILSGVAAVMAMFQSIEPETCAAATASSLAPRVTVASSLYFAAAAAARKLKLVTEVLTSFR